MIKILILSGGGESSVNLYNTLSKHYTISSIIVEGKSSRKKFLQNRVKRLGYFKVFGQIMFQVIVPKLLTASSKDRINELKSKYQLDDSEIPSTKLFNVSSVNSPNCISYLKKERPDLIIVNGTRIISKKVLNCISTTFVNTHVGITPKYRGVHGAYWALVNNDRENCGVTVHKVDAGIDTGSVIHQTLIEPTVNDNFVTYPLMQLGEGIELMIRTIDEFISGNLQVVKPKETTSNLFYHPTLWFYIYAKITRGVS